MHVHVSSPFHWLLSSYFKTNKNTDETEKEEKERESMVPSISDDPKLSSISTILGAQMKYMYNVSTIRSCNITYFLKPANV